MSDQTIRLSPSDHTAAAVALIVAANDALNRLSGDEAPVMATIGQTFQAAQAQALLAVAGHLGTLVAEVTELRLALDKVAYQFDQMGGDYPPRISVTGSTVTTRT